MPETSSAARLAVVVEDLIAVLNNPHPPTRFLQRGDPINDAIRQLRVIFNIPNNYSDTRTNNGTNNPLITNQPVPRVNTRSNSRNNNVAVPRVPVTTTNNNNRCQNRTSNNRRSTTTSTNNLAPRVQIPQQRNHRQPRVVPAIPQTTQQRPRVRMAPINE